MSTPKDDDGFDIDKLINDALKQDKEHEHFGVTSANFDEKLEQCSKAQLVQIAKTLRNDLTSAGVIIGVSFTSFALIEEALNALPKEMVAKIAPKLKAKLAASAELARQALAKTEELVTIDITVAEVDAVDDVDVNIMLKKIMDSVKPPDNKEKS